MHVPRVARVWLRNGTGRRPGRGGYWVEWYELSLDGVRRKRARRFASRELARAAQQEIQRRLNAWATGKSQTRFADATARYIVSLAHHSADYRQRMERLILALDAQGVKTCAQFSREAIERHLAGRGDVKSVTRRSDWRHLRAMGEWLHQAGYLPANPVATIRPPRREAPMPKRAPKAHEWARWLEVIPQTPGLDDQQAWHLLILIAAVTGLRRQDVVRIAISNIRLGDSDTNGCGIVQVSEGKTRKRVPVALPPLVSDRIATRIAGLPVGSELLFPWGGRWKRVQFERIRDTSGVRFAFQALRRAAGTRAALTRLRSAGAAHLHHSSADVFRDHYEQTVELVTAVALSLELPSLPPLPPALPTPARPRPSAD